MAWAKHVNWSICYLNPYFQAQLGLDQNEWPTFTADTERRLRAAWDKFGQESVEGQAIDLVCQMKSGQELSFTGILTPYQKEGRLTGAWISLTPVSISQPSIPRSQTYFDSLFDHPHLGIGFCDPNGRLYRINEALRHLLKLPAQLALVLNLPDLCLGSPEKIEAALAELASGKQDQVQLAEVLRCEFHEPIPCELFLRAIKGARGEVEEILVTIEDLSDSIAQQDALARSEERFRSLFEKAPFPIGLRDLETNRLVDANDALKEIFGTAEKNPIGMHRREYIHTENAKLEAQLMEKLRRREISSYSLEKIYNKGDGGQIQGIMTRMLLEMQGKPYAVAFINDVTTYKEQEKKLAAQNQQLQLINDQLDRFIYSATHELRAPLTSILGLISLIRNEPINPETEAYLTLQEQSVMKLDAYLRKIIVHSDNNNSALDISMVDLQMMVQQLYREMLPEEVVEMETEVISRLDSPFYSDPNRVRTIVQNLLSNAIQFADFQKSQPFVRTYLEPRPGGIRIRVEDNGIGIETSIQPQVFEMLFRGSIHSKGSGMGLFIADEMVRKLGGDISLKSTHGEGTIFVVDLPTYTPDYS